MAKLISECIERKKEKNKSRGLFLWTLKKTLWSHYTEYFELFTGTFTFKILQKVNCPTPNCLSTTANHQIIIDGTVIYW